MKNARRIVSGQLRIGDTDLPTYRLADILSKIDSAQKLAGLNRILFHPSHNPSVNRSIVKHCRKRGIQAYLWYKVLCDNDIMPERSETIADAFGGIGSGESGKWDDIHNSDESFVFGCPVNEKYNTLLLNRCRQQLADYDGLFIDTIGYPLPSLGLEGVFTCFCNVCMEREPHLREWRRRVQELRENSESCTDEDFERWGTFRGHANAFGLMGFYKYRTNLLTQLAKRYADMARECGKEVGIDVVAPALAYLAGHDYPALGTLFDWLKPRIYCHIFGPSSIPLEYYCMAIGSKSWAKRASMPAIMQFISRSVDLDMPKSFHNLTQTYLPSEAAFSQIRKAVSLTPTPIHAGIECSLHPDYETDLDEHIVKAYFEAARNCHGTTLAWNLLFIPDAFLRIGGKVNAE